MAPDGRLPEPAKLIQALRSYSDWITDWAAAVAESMVADVARRDESMWRSHSKEMGRRLREELTNSPTGGVLRDLQASQVELIKSIPLAAAERVHHLTSEAVLQSKRASEVAAEILKTEAVTETKARLIARTEVARAQSNLVQARAQYAGSEGYIWRTAEDGDVRPSHNAMEGKYVRWSSPPTLDGLTGHAGTLPNCRCFAEPVFPNDDV
jgi:SPP1 gp7 family putative phage head morphogenesis protein